MLGGETEAPPFAVAGSGQELRACGFMGAFLLQGSQ
jgi:hypothetical protein